MTLFACCGGPRSTTGGKAALTDGSAKGLLDLLGGTLDRDTRPEDSPTAPEPEPEPEHADDSIWTMSKWINSLPLAELISKHLAPARPGKGEQDPRLYST